MSISFRTQLDAYLRQHALPQHKYGHQPRLYALTLEIAAGIWPVPSYDDDVVFAAAFLHDLGVFVGHRPEDPAELARWDHVAYTCACAPDLLERFGFPGEKISAVLACIREHQPKDEPGSFEATLLRDADILEQLGAIAVLRTSAKLGSDTRFHRFADVRDALQQAVTDLPSKLRLPAARELAVPRLATLQLFLKALDEEAGEHLD
jgi:uncharacterized protein